MATFDTSRENGNADDFFQFDGAVDAATATDEGDVAAPKVPPRLGLLANLNESEFDAVARAARLNFLEAGNVVFEQGEQADRFFILVDGSVEVRRDGELLATLGGGSFFGESALLVDGKRSATVTAVINSALWSVDYQAFRDVVSHHLLADEQAAGEVRSRLAQTPPDSFR